MFLSAHEAVPVGPYLGVRSVLLKALGQRFHPAGEALQRFGDGRVRRRRDRIGQAGAGADLLQVVGQQQGREEQVPRLGEAPQRGRRLLGVMIDRRGEPLEMLLLAVAAGDIVASAANIDVDIGHLARLPGANQRVELGEGAGDPAAHRVMPGLEQMKVLALSGRRWPRRYGLDPGERPLDPRDGIKGALVGHDVTIA